MNLWGLDSNYAMGLSPTAGGQVFLLDAWGTRAQKPHIVQETSFCLASPPKAARPTNHSFLEHVCLFGLGTPGLQKIIWPKNHFGMPLNKGSDLVESLLLAEVWGWILNSTP